jgi:hypothetical protein
MITNDDILNSKEKYIAHQCNCVVNNPKGLAKSIFDKYPYADIYSSRKNKDIPGHNIICSGNDKIIINMLAQYYPGKSKYNNDSVPNRLQWFRDCLNEISNIPDLKNKKESLAIPFNIGCGLAGGNWDDYYSIIKEQNINIVLYKF